jgi:protocatechuate 3,4-dioxygenase beta subunit
MWSVVVETEGRLPMEARLVPLVEDVVLPVVELVPAARLTVRVMGPAGTPIPGARVLALPAEEPGTGRTWTAARRDAVIRGDGTATLRRAPGEPLRVLARAAGFAEGATGPTGEPRVDLTLEPASVRAVRVRDAGGSPVAEALLRSGEGDWPVAVTDERGRARIEGRAGDGIHLVVETATGASGAADVADETGPSEDGEPVPVRLPPSVSLSGRAIDTLTGDPVAGAAVWTPRDPGRFARTAARGEVRLEGLRAGDRSVRFAAAGYFEEVHRLPEPRDERRVTATVAMIPAAAASGVVVDGARQPVPGAEVRWSLHLDTKASLTGLLHRGGGTVRSRADGTFALKRLLPGETYDLRVSKQGYAPATASVSGLRAFLTRDGVRVTLERGRTGRGTITDAHGAPIPGARVSLHPQPESVGTLIRSALETSGGAATVFEGRTGPDGRFAIDQLPPDTYDMSVEAPGFAGTTVPGIEIPGGTGSVDLGSLALTAAAALEGSVIDSEGSPVEGAEIRVGSTDPLTAFVEARRRETGGEGDEPDAVSAGDGWFRIGDLAPGERVRLRASHPTHAAASTVTEVPNPEPVEIVLPVAATVGGRVLDERGDPVPSALVALYSAGEGPGGAARRIVPIRAENRVATEKTGAFLFRGVRPGAADLEVAARGFELERLGDLELEPGGELLDLEVTLRPAARIGGRVTSADGRPVPGARVRVVHGPGHHSGVEQAFGIAFTDGDGRYRLESVAPGPTRISAEHDDHDRVTRKIEARRGDNELDIVFDRGVEITGRVVDELGTPLPGARLSLLPPDRAFGGRRATAGADGSFAFHGVRRGEYRLRAEREGYAAAEEPVGEVVEPIHGLELRLGTGGAVVGQIYGLELDELARVRLLARSADASGGGLQMGTVGYDGAFRIGSLASGTWRVVATLPGTGRQAEGSATVEAGGTEAWLDLELGTGWTLWGSVQQSGRPLGGRSVNAVGLDVSDGGMAETDHQGRFRIEGLTDGTYEIGVIGRNGSPVYGQVVEIDSDRTLSIDLPVGELGGRVVRASDLAPLSGVAVTVERASPAGGFARGDTTDSAGRFRLRDLGEGSYVVTARKEGYAPGKITVHLEAGGSAGDVELVLRPAAPGATPGPVLE